MKRVTLFSLISEIYATLGENELLHTRPSTIYFEGFDVGRKYIRKLVSCLETIFQNIDIMRPKQKVLLFPH